MGIFKDEVDLLHQIAVCACWANLGQPRIRIRNFACRVYILYSTEYAIRNTRFSFSRDYILHVSTCI